MENFIVKNINTQDINFELQKIGFDEHYKNAASDKFRYKTFKIFNLTSAQANILKQTAISVGTDCAVHRDVITGKIEQSNALLTGSYSQIKKIVQKLKTQPFSLNMLADEIASQLELNKNKTKLVGIVNVTPDSFSDGLQYFKPENAILHSKKLISDGADIIEIGGESTRPYAQNVSADEQIKRIAPVLEALRDIEVPISVDTRNSIVAKYALEHGATIINDVSGFDYDEKMADVISKFNATVVLQHSKGTPQNMQDNPHYRDVIEEIYFSLKNKIQFAQEKNINNIILDVGIGFGKKTEDNFIILNRISEFFSLKYPLMVGVSRKSLLGITDDDNELKDALTLAISYPLILQNVSYLRVHNVKYHKHLLDLVNKYLTV